MTIRQISEVLKEAWGTETSSDPANWSPSNPALGQCAVTALVVHDAFGGEIVWSDVVKPDGEHVSHYFNILEDGHIVDLTREQFPYGSRIPCGIAKNGGFNSTRDYVLAFPNTVRRYERLKQALDSRMSDLRGNTRELAGVER